MFLLHDLVQLCVFLAGELLAGLYWELNATQFLLSVIKVTLEILIILPQLIQWSMYSDREHSLYHFSSVNCITFTI